MNLHPDAEPQDINSRYYSSFTFNCHGFAWYMESANESALSDPRWINDEAKYMSDDSYKEVMSETYPGKISWSTGSHSAITTSVSGVYLSKWGFGPLMEHDWDDSPYGTQNLKYYKLCYRELTDPINSTTTRDDCRLLIKNTTLSSNIDLIIDYEDWVKIEGTFSTGSGATLIISPN